MLAARFEDDMIELSGGGYLMLCAGRRRVFVEGVDGGPVPLDDLLGFAAEEGAVVVRTAAADRGDLRCPFEGSTAAELADPVARLNDRLAAWR